MLRLYSLVPVKVLSKVPAVQKLILS